VVGPDLAKICYAAYLLCMSTMNISLPDALKSFVDKQVAKRGYATSSKYVRELVRADQDRERLRELLLEALHRKPQQQSTKVTSATSEIGFDKPGTSEDEACPAS
jgi:putative addiction module CopG family antidote